MKFEQEELTVQMMPSWMQDVGIEDQEYYQPLRGQPLEVGFQILWRTD